MSKFQPGDKVKIIRHPTRPEYCGLEGKVSNVREGLKGVTQPVPDGGILPALGKQDKYDIDVGPHTVYDLLEEWLETSDRS